MRYFTMLWRAIFGKRRVYLDHAAATPVRPEVINAMRPYWREYFGNPEAIHTEGETARHALADARLRVADVLDMRPDGIIFTSGGTEADNLITSGFLATHCADGATHEDVHLITSAIEHPAVLESFARAEAAGARVTYLPVNAEGIVEPAVLREALEGKAVLVSIGYINNEIGIVQPIAALAKEVRRFRSKHPDAYVLFHTDASQAPVYCTIRMPELGADAMTLDAQKIFGPKGVGCLALARDVALTPMLVGGGQEAGRRAGTQNIPGIVGFAEALARAATEAPQAAARVSVVRDDCIAQLCAAFPAARINGGGTERVANTVSVMIPGLDAEYAIIALDKAGFALSARSACAGRTAVPSHVLSSIGLSEEEAASTLRITIGPDTTRRDITRFIRALIAHVMMQTRTDMTNI